MLQQTTSGEKPIRFLPEEHTDVIVTVVRDDLPWLVAAVVLVAGTGILWWRWRRRSRETG